MKAWRVSVLGEPREAMSLDQIPDPAPGAGQLLVRVLGAAANFADALICRGLYQVRPPLPFTPGLELCGEVAALGPGTTGFAVGERVIGLSALPAGGFAELALMDAATTFPAPGALDDAQAAALYIGYQTGWFGLHRRAQLQPGETLLVHAAAGGVGSAAVQLGKAAGARVVGVVGGPEKVEVARTLGADVVVDRHTEDFVEVVKDFTHGRGADVVYDPVGGGAYQRSTKCIAFEGRILVVGFAGGQIQSAALNHALVKNYSVVGLHWGLYTTKNPALVRVCHDELSRLAADGVVNPLVSERLALDAVADGLQRLADGTTVGRVAYVSQRSQAQSSPTESSPTESSPTESSPTEGQAVTDIRTAIITGAARGIGAAIARRLSSDGFAVAVLDLDETACKPVVDEINASGGKALAVGVDVADEQAVATAVRRVAEELGAPTVLVNNAGITRDNLLFKMTADDWDAVMGVHLRGSFLMSRATQKHMTEAKWGRIINLSSVSALGSRGQANYAAAKAGLQGFTKTLAIELGRFGVTVNAIAPGFIETEMTASTARRLGVPFEDFKAAAAKAIPVARVGQPEDIAATVSFLAREDASFVSGQVIYVAGGPRA